ncbi:DUF4810 domain-containing protein [Pseudomonas fluorescens]|uniref:DUF4810 domain-containing protein n=1 Tax=Pseudomonas fluorescens TaxID=294 RepID=A0A5E7QGV6_PSEFL|nr:DUF4810 domain-containing protein [Pseudomonas fluorescens]VVP60530.1 hypothetical protein PS880_06163 [Pseudomonas fluorescens]
MKGNTSRTGCLAWGVLLTVMTLPGCKQKPERPPEDSYYPPEHLQYQEDAAQEQIEALEADVGDIKAQGGVVPPGYYAQLGLLYFNLGKTEQMRQRLKEEQDPFPESTAFMNDLMSHAKSAGHPEPVDPPAAPEALIEPPGTDRFQP